MNKTQKIVENIKRIIPQTLKNRVNKYTFEFGKEVEAKEFFSQYGEDTFLQAYFCGKTWSKYRAPSIMIENGFYVDVGAFNPKLFSNTYWFYKRGWRGINIDATPGIKEAFDLARPRDLNIHAAISNEEKDLIFYDWGKSVFNTLSEEKAKDNISRWGVGEPKQIKIQTTRLEKILDNSLPINQSISFLSVDVEGYDLEVLQSNNWNKYKPELVVVEDHKKSIEKIIESPITNFMNTVGYKIISWIPPSIIYVSNEVALPEHIRDGTVRD